MKTLGNICIRRYCITLILLLFCAVTAHTQENRKLYLKTNAIGLGMAVDQLFGGGQGVYGLKEYTGVNVNYPTSNNPGE